MRTFGVRRHADVPAKGIEKMYGFERLEALLPLADVVAMAVPRSPQTHHLLNADRLGRLKSTAIVINAGRGDAIDHELGRRLAQWTAPRCRVGRHRA
mgnify:CR=1 FL=1